MPIVEIAVPKITDMTHSLLIYFLEYPDALVLLFGFALSVFTFWYTSSTERKLRAESADKDRALQHRRNYLSLEFEASRIFQICVDNPNIPLYLNNKLPKTDGPVAEQTYWFVCQVLDVFEIIISFRREGMVTSDLFATWVPWFRELGTAARFKDYWRGKKLWSNYKGDLQNIMNAAQVLLDKRKPGFDEDEALDESELKAFYHDVSVILADPTILTSADASHKKQNATSAEPK